jgi:thioesterase domain-containing protein
MDATSKKTALSPDVDERLAKLSNAKRALLERRLARSGADATVRSDRVRTSPSWSSLVPIQAGGSRPPFFWIHGENSTVFLPRFLGPDQPIYGVFHQSRDGKRVRYTTVEAMAAHYLSEIRTAQPEGPYYLGGFCIGGTIAVEMASSLRAEGHEVALVIIVDATPAHPVFRKKRNSLPKTSGNTAGETSLAARLGGFRGRIAARGLAGKIELLISTSVEKAGALPAVTARAVAASRAKVAQAAGYLKDVGSAGAKFAKRTAGKFYYRTGAEPIPAKLVNFYLDAVYRRAIQEYKGQRYDGEVISLNTLDAPFDPRGFEKFTGGLKVIELDAKHDQVMYWEEQIQLVAEKIKFYLEEAQSRRSAAGA